MYANDQALGRNHSTSDNAAIVAGGTYMEPWFRVELTWNDGAKVYETYDTREEAVAHLVNLGWNA